MKHEAGVRERGHGITDSVMTGFISMGAAHGRCVRPCRPWGMALVLLVVAACGGGGGSGSSNSSNDTDDTATVESVSLDRETLLLENGDSASITATLHLSNGGTASQDSDVNWFVDSSSFATIDGETGTTATVKAGDDVGWTTVTAESGGHKATADIYVSENVALQVRPSTTFLPPECSGLVTARLITDQGVTQDVTRDVSWSVSNSDAITVATGNSSAGRVGAGTPETVPVASVVRASYRGRRASGRVIVADLKSIAFIDSHDGQAVPAEGIELAQGEPRRLRAMGTFTQDEEFPEFPDRDVTGCVEWSSDDTNVATVNTGLITAGSEVDTTHVTASYGDGPLKNNVKVTVNQDLVTGLFIDEKDQVNINQGATKNLIARAKISDDPDPAPDVTAAVDWRSDDPGIATVGNETGSRGRVTGVAPGQAVVTAALSGFHDSVTVNVTLDPDEPGELSMNADPNVVLAGDSDDVSEICTYLISSGSFDPVLSTKVDFSFVEGVERADLVPDDESTGSMGEPACVDLSPKDVSEPGSVIVRAEESDSGLAETVNVGLVSSLADVFDTTGDVDPPLSGGMVSSGTVFQATLVNGSNREFTVAAATLAFCTEFEPVEVSTQGPSDDQVPGGGEIEVSVETKSNHPSDGFAIALSLSDVNTGQSFPVRHQFTDTEVTCNSK